jgi:hypothetical protein
MRFTPTVLNRLVALVCLMFGLAAIAAQAQQPTAAQTGAIPFNCRSDFIENCSDVTPGGKDALDCLKQNLAKLSGPCSAAVSAIAPAASAPTQNPAPIAPATTPAAPAQTPPPATAAKPSPAKKPADTPAAKLDPAPPPPAPPAAAAVPAVAPLTPRPFIMPERRLVILESCKADARSLCAGTPPGGGRLIDCLAANAGRLSPMCYDAIARVSR